jgi:Xaa-Pro aminopeptidase
MKATKNPIELAGYRACHHQDGAAWVNFLAWLSREVPLREAAGNPLTELEVQAQQLAFRKQQPGLSSKVLRPSPPLRAMRRCATIIRARPATSPSAMIIFT